MCIKWYNLTTTDKRVINKVQSIDKMYHICYNYISNGG